MTMQHLLPTQYSKVSAWVPAKFKAPKLLPDIPAWLSGRSKKAGAEPQAAEKQFRQVCSRPADVFAEQHSTGS